MAIAGFANFANLTYHRELLRFAAGECDYFNLLMFTSSIDYNIYYRNVHNSTQFNIQSNSIFSQYYDVR